jgi:polyisoprenoid-binding protein YceI
MRVSAIALCAALLLFVTGNLSSSEKFSETKRVETEKSSAVVRYRLDASQSKFMVHAFRGGLAWFKGHDHFIAARDFTGEAGLSLDAVNPASLKLTVRADSLEETDAAFTPQQKQIIKKELEDLVLETKKYPEITFESTDVQGNLNGGQIDVKIGGNLTLHGVTKRIVIPARVTASGETLRAQGEFEINRKDFNVNATNAFHGAVRVKHELKFTFDIVGQRIL